MPIRPIEDHERIAVSLRHASELLDLSPYHITRAVRAGELHPRRVGVKMLFCLDELRAWFDALPHHHGGVK